MMNLCIAAWLIGLLVTCSGLPTSSSLSERGIKAPPLSRPQADGRMIYLHSETINTLKDKDLRFIEETPDSAQHFQYLVHVDEVNAEYTQHITAQIEEWSGKIVYL